MSVGPEARIVLSWIREPPPGVALCVRRIMPGDEHLLLPEERATLGGGLKALRQSASARLAARELLARLGLADAPLPRTGSGAPDWPAGAVGSLAHSGGLAVAAVASCTLFSALGVDLEPDEPFDPRTARRIATPGELRRHGVRTVESRLLFAAKEAAFKAFHRVDGLAMDFQALEVDLDRGSVRRADGAVAGLCWARGPGLLTLAFVRAA